MINMKVSTSQSTSHLCLVGHPETEPFLLVGALFFFFPYDLFTSPEVLLLENKQFYFSLVTQFLGTYRKI